MSQTCIRFLGFPSQTLRQGQEVLTLEGFLNLERAMPDATDAQHIANKLLYDAANEALINCYRYSG